MPETAELATCPAGAGARCHGACLVFLGAVWVFESSRCSLTVCRDAEKAEKLKKDNEKSEEKLPADANA